jgi:energy-coupling factor transporter ATP-binding protein EcfA2
MPNYFIERLHASQVGLFDELDVEFNKRFNFITGPNGSGKTTILKCLALCLEVGEVKNFRYGLEAELWTNFIYNDEKYKLGFGKGWIADPLTYRKVYAKQLVRPPVETGRTSYVHSDLDNNKISYAPLFLGAYRRINYSEVVGPTKDKGVQEAIREYRRRSIESINGTDLPGVKNWLVTRDYQVLKEWAKYEKANWIFLMDNFSLIAPRGMTLNLLRIGRDHEPVFSLNGDECYLEELSSGFQAVLSLVLSIINWIESINEGEDMLIQNAKGTVIIDELDVHLHPEWQFTIRDTLERLFPNLQFIVTTHSPHIIAAAQPNEILVIREHNRYLNLIPNRQTYAGWDTNQILEEVMGVKSLDNRLYSRIIDEAYEHIQAKDVTGLESKIQELKAVAHPNDEIVQVLEIRLAKLKLDV